MISLLKGSMAIHRKKMKILLNDSVIQYAVLLMPTLEPFKTIPEKLIFCNLSHGSSSLHNSRKGP